MARGGGLMTKKELGETHDVLRFGVNDSVHGDLALAHPVQATIKEAKFWDKKKKFGTEAIYGSTFNIRRDLDTQILSRLVLSLPPPGNRFCLTKEPPVLDFFSGMIWELQLLGLSIRPYFFCFVEQIRAPTFRLLHLKAHTLNACE
ncbi:cyclin-B1-2-like isoform X1 [Triticum dicoccoides]|uniref:cyclin-B1-2-like isoform X1 n=1 Tax=Triticum dicoccoides TaxID=85692 RepID=UPI0018915D8A|nr:cyclin-B1-2-like isoform X1 [Triticum dicoccoides]